MSAAARSSTIAQEVRAGQIVGLGIAGGRFMRQIGVVHARARPVTGPAREFVRVLLGREQEA